MFGMRIILNLLLLSWAALSSASSVPVDLEAHESRYRVQATPTPYVPARPAPTPEQLALLTPSTPSPPLPVALPKKSRKIRLKKVRRRNRARQHFGEITTTYPTTTRAYPTTTSAYPTTASTRSSIGNPGSAARRKTTPAPFGPDYTALPRAQPTVFVRQHIHDNAADELYEEQQKQDGRPYSFEYGVRDADSGTDFSRAESRSGSVTKGSYQVALPDGRIQTVSYVADENGFKASVEYLGQAVYPEPEQQHDQQRVHGQQQAHPPSVNNGNRETFQYYDDGNDYYDDTTQRGLGHKSAHSSTHNLGHNSNLGHNNNGQFRNTNQFTRRPKALVHHDDDDHFVNNKHNNDRFVNNEPSNEFIRGQNGGYFVPVASTTTVATTRPTFSPSTFTPTRPTFTPRTTSFTTQPPPTSFYDTAAYLNGGSDAIAEANDNALNSFVGTRSIGNVGHVGHTLDNSLATTTAPPIPITSTVSSIDYTLAPGVDFTAAPSATASTTVSPLIFTTLEPEVHVDSTTLAALFDPDDTFGRRSKATRRPRRFTTPAAAPHRVVVKAEHVQKNANNFYSKDNPFSNKKKENKDKTFKPLRVAEKRKDDISKPPKETEIKKDSNKSERKRQNNPFIVNVERSSIISRDRSNSNKNKAKEKLTTKEPKVATKAPKLTTKEASLATKAPRLASREPKLFTKAVVTTPRPSVILDISVDRSQHRSQPTKTVSFKRSKFGNPNREKHEDSNTSIDTKLTEDKEFASFPNFPAVPRFTTVSSVANQSPEATTYRPALSPSLHWVLRQ